MRKNIVKNSILRSKSIDKIAFARYNIYIIKQQILIKSEGRRPPDGTQEAAEEKRTA
jgi:hypothetical protein